MPDYEKMYKERQSKHKASEEAAHKERKKKYGSFNPLAGRQEGILVDKLKEKKRRESY